MGEKKAELFSHQIKILEELRCNEKPGIYKKYEDALDAYDSNRNLINEHFFNRDEFFRAWYCGYEEVKELESLKLF